MSSAIEIANTYVALTVKAPGIRRDIDKLLGSAAGAGDKAGTSLGQRMASTAGKALKVSAAALGGVLAVGIGTALVKGFQRLDAIDTARAKLTGLGNDTKTVDKIMQNALASVKGTAFGLGDAAGVAAQAVAAGIKPGQALEGVMKTIANTAAAAGTGIGDMGSIFAKAMTQANGVQNDVISQLADRGIPIYQELGKTLGVTAGEVFKLASEGKVNFEQFASAATAASGTVAAEMGFTWSGLKDNLFASLGRIGEGLLSGIFPQLKGGLQDITAVLTPLEAGAKGVGAAIGAFVSDVGPKFVDVLKRAWEAGSDAVGWVKDNVTWISTLVVTIGGAVAVWALWTGAITLWTTASTAATVATKAFGAAIKAHPIGAIVSAIVAAVGALVWFFTQTKEGKAIWQEFTRFLGEAWTNISGFITAAWENVIQPVFKAIGDIAVWLYENVLKPVFDGISAVVQFFAAGFKLQFDLVVNAFRLVGAIAGWLWTNAVQPAFTAIGAIVQWLWQTIIQPAFAAIGAVFNWVWLNVIKPVTDYIGLAIKGLGIIFEWLYANIVKPVWDRISGAMRAAWAWINAYVFAPFKIGIDLIGKAFDNVAKAIGTAWDGIKKAAAVPINFVLDTVWNKGLRSFWNDMVKELGLGDMALPAAKLVKFASGGVMPGYTPGRDVHQFWSPTAGGLALSGGEAIMRPEFTRLVGGAAGVDAINAAARNGKLPIGDGAGNFFGDAWDAISKAASVAWDFISNPAQAIKSHVIDGIIRPLMGDQNVFGRAVGGMAEKTLMGFVDLFKTAVPKGAGTKGMGWEAMWQMVRNAIPGAVMTSNYRSPGANAGVGGVKGSYHTQGRAIDLVPANMAMFNQVARLFPNASELIYTPAGNRQLLNGKPFSGWSDKVKQMHHNHVHLAMASGGVVPKLYDDGGWMPHGGMAVNRSGKPEAVLTPDESLGLKRGLAGPSQLVIVDINGDLIGRMGVEADHRIAKVVGDPTANKMRVHASLAGRRL